MVANSTQQKPVYDSAAQRRPWIVELVELYRYRDLLVQLIARNIKTRYKRSVLGIFWTMLNPLFTMIVLSLVFSQVFRFQTKYYATYALAGLIFWNFFAQTTSHAISELLWGSTLLNRIYVPRAIFAATALGTGLVNFLIALVPLLLIMLVTRTPIRLSLLFLPVPVVLIACFAMGVSLLLARLAIYFADVLDMYQILLTLWMYLTPIIYPKNILPARFYWVLNLNPMYHLLEVFRAPIYAGWLAGPKTLAAATLIAFSTLVFGWWFFTRKADELSYRV